MILYTNGCSHTAGGCMKTIYTWPHIVMKSLTKLKSYLYNPPNYEFSSKDVLYNEARHGAGNDYIFHKTLETVTGLIESGNKPDFVIIQWSGPNRRLHCYPDGRNVFVNLYDYTGFGVKFEPLGSEHTIHYMFSLQEFLKQNEIEYWFFNYMIIDESVKNLNILEKIDMGRFINFGLNDILFEGLINFFKSKNMCCDEAGHPNEEGNYLIGLEVAKKIGVDLIDLKTFFKTFII